MTTSVEPTSQTPGLIACFILVAYIFYYLGTHQINPIPQSITNPSPHQIDNSESMYQKGYKDGQHDQARFKDHDLRAEMQKAMKKLEEMGMKVAEVSKQEEQRQNWFEDRKKEFKGWREDQLSAIWRGKQPGRNGVKGWLRFGGIERGRKLIEAPAEKENPITEKAGLN